MLKMMIYNIVIRGPYEKAFVPTIRCRQSQIFYCWASEVLRPHLLIISARHWWRSSWAPKTVATVCLPSSQSRPPWLCVALSYYHRRTRLAADPLPNSRHIPGLKFPQSPQCSILTWLNSRAAVILMDTQREVAQTTCFVARNKHATTHPQCDETTTQIKDRRPPPTDQEPPAVELYFRTAHTPMQIVVALLFDSCMCERRTVCK